MYYFFKWTSVCFFFFALLGSFSVSALILSWPAHCKSQPVYFPVFILQGACAAILVSTAYSERKNFASRQRQGAGFSLWHDGNSFLKIYLMQTEGKTQQQTFVSIFYFCLSHHVIIWPERKWHTAHRCKCGWPEGSVFGRKKIILVDCNHSGEIISH